MAMWSKDGERMSAENGKVCCNCRHNIRTGEFGDIKCHCDIDGHYIGYVECFDHWCRRWAKSHKFDEEVNNERE